MSESNLIWSAGQRAHLTTSQYVQKGDCYCSLIISTPLQTGPPASGGFGASVNNLRLISISLFERPFHWASAHRYPSRIVMCTPSSPRGCRSPPECQPYASRCIKKTGAEPPSLISPSISPGKGTLLSRPITLTLKLATLYPALGYCFL